MAAQERTKQAQNKPTPPPPSNDADLLMTLDAPTNDPPPPAFDSSFFPAAPAELPPPAFDSVQDSIMPQMDMSFPPPPPMDAVAPPPHLHSCRRHPCRNLRLLRLKTYWMEDSIIINQII